MEVLITKFGRCKLNSEGYYRVTSKKEGNNGKLLHRLVFEDFYNIDLNKEFPDGIDIHHIDGDKSNCEIWNLEPMSHSHHARIHNIGEDNPMYGVTGKNHHLYNKPVSKITCDKISKANKGRKWSNEQRKQLAIDRNSTGYYRVSKSKSPSYTQGFVWVYSYTDEFGNRKTIKSVNLEKLKQTVISSGLVWEEI